MSGTSNAAPLDDKRHFKWSRIEMVGPPTNIENSEPESDAIKQTPLLIATDSRLEFV
jgi:hypothetical protein